MQSGRFERAVHISARHQQIARDRQDNDLGNRKWQNRGDLDDRGAPRARRQHQGESESDREFEDQARDWQNQIVDHRPPEHRIAREHRIISERRPVIVERPDQTAEGREHQCGEHEDCGNHDERGPEISRARVHCSSRAQHRDSLVSAAGAVAGSGLSIFARAAPGAVPRSSTARMACCHRLLSCG